MLKETDIYLRPLEPTDATLILTWENDPKNWSVSGTEVPYALHQIEAYLEHAHDVRATKQLRLVICNNETQEPVGLIDLYDISFKMKRAGVGILISGEENRRKGYASQALKICLNYAYEILEIDNFYCSIHASNTSSRALFEKHNFESIGIRKRWYKVGPNEWEDDYIYQRILTK